MELTLERYGDQELWYAEADDQSWRFPLWIFWHQERTTREHYALVLPALCPFHTQSLALVAFFQPHDIRGLGTSWVISRKMAEALLRKAPGVTPACYYLWPGSDPPVTKTLKDLSVELKEREPKSLAHESFVQYLSRRRSISSSIINVVLTAIGEEAPGWMIGERKPVDLGFCRLLAVPFRANWKELVVYKAKVLGLGLRAIFRLPVGERAAALRDAGLQELLTSPHNVGLCHGWRGKSVRIDYTIEAVSGEKFEQVANAIEAKRQASGATSYVACYEETVEALYDYLVQAMQAFLHKVNAPFAQVCEGGSSGILRFLPVLGRKVRVRDKALRNYPVHIVPPDNNFSVFGQQSDPRLIQGTPVILRKVSHVLPAPVDVRKPEVNGHLYLEGGTGAAGLSLPHASQGTDAGQPMLAEPEAGPGVDGEGDWNI